MQNLKKLIIACDGESASGKSTAAKLISKKYNLLLINSGLLYRYASKLVIKFKPKNEVLFLKKRFKKLSYHKIKNQNLHSEEISNHVAFIAKNKKNLLKLVQKIVPKSIDCFFVRQNKPSGLGHAIHCAKNIVNNEPFAVILADDLIKSRKPCLKQLTEIYYEKESTVVALEKLKRVNQVNMEL